MTRKTPILLILALALVALCPPAVARPPARGLDERLARLAAEKAELERELERYRAGLERAVAELNRLRALRLRDTPPARSRTPPGEQILSVAQVRLEGRRATVTGTIRNDEIHMIRGDLTIELLRDGHPAGAVHLPFVAASASHTPYAHTFELEGYAAGSYAARAELNH